MKTITEFEIVDHGVEHEQYFQGCGVSFTKFETVATGIGNSLRKALNDAAEGIAQQGYELSDELNSEIDNADNTNRIPKEEEDNIDFGIHSDNYTPDIWYYASIRVK